MSTTPRKAPSDSTTLSAIERAFHATVREAARLATLQMLGVLPPPPPRPGVRPTYRRRPGWPMLGDTPDREPTNIADRLGGALRDLS